MFLSPLFFLLNRSGHQIVGVRQVLWQYAGLVYSIFECYNPLIALQGAISGVQRLTYNSSIVFLELIAHCSALTLSKTPHFMHSHSSEKLPYSLFLILNTAAHQFWSPNILLNTDFEINLTFYIFPQGPAILLTSNVVMAS